MGRGMGRGLRGGPRGSFRGGFRGGFSHANERSFNQDLYADYSGPDQAHASNGGFGNAQQVGPTGFGGFDAAPSQQIMVRNVSF